MTKSMTIFCGCYKSKSSAARAMRTWVGNKIDVSFPGISDRFETSIVLRKDMLAVTQFQGDHKFQGLWGFDITYTSSDLLCVILGDDGFPKNVPYAEVAHWISATEPCVKTPRGTFPVRFDSLDEAFAAGYKFWFRHNDGTIIVEDRYRACGVRAPKAA
ncbi:MAG: hypothetical protein LBP61_01550 [Desulfovibrio sp.]|nr:hypothetical protein [Desulfovibrio sp.]